MYFFKNQSPYTLSELCETNTIQDTPGIGDTNGYYYGEAPHVQEGFGMTFMDLLMLKTDTDY